MLVLSFKKTIFATGYLFIAPALCHEVKLCELLVCVRTRQKSEMFLSFE